MSRPQQSELFRGLRIGLSLGLIVVGILLVAGHFRTTRAADSREMGGYVDRLVDLYWTVQREYIEDVDPEKAIYGSIHGMLSTLDPHSSFLDPKTYRRMREGQKGSFSGLGIMVGVRNGKLTVISPIEGTPAYRAGIRAGDVIAEIETEETKDMTLEEAVSKLRGPRGSSIVIQIKRAGFANSFPITIIRDDIRTRSIEHSFLLRPGVGYIRIKDFTSTTASELDQALLQLEQKGMERLILDLRGNPGGLLDQAVSVSERFLQRGEMVVYTRGRVSQANSEFTASGRRMAVDLPLVVLVDEGSASASEIVAGAIQDHDRGLIVGKRTWGKGLVQSVYSLPGETAMALTTARYYTPAGRLIQRDYSSFYDYYFRAQDDESYAQGPVSHTDLGREVHGGGGIAPDVEISRKEIPQLQQELEFRHQAFFGFANLLAAAHRAKFASTADEVSPNAGVGNVDSLVLELVPEEGLNRDWIPDEKVKAAFLEYLKREEIDVDLEEVVPLWSGIADVLRRETAIALNGLLAGYRVQVEMDEQILGALELFPDAERLAQGNLLEVEDPPQ